MSVNPLLSKDGVRVGTMGPTQTCSSCPSGPRGRFLGSLLSLLVLNAALIGQPSRTVIRGAQVIDGSGRSAFEATILVEEGRISGVGSYEPSSSDRVIEGEGLVLAPGFVDLHSHSQRGLLQSPEALTQVSQGITTLVVGADGSAPFPPADYLKRLGSQGTAVNVAVMAGHGTLRRMVMGQDFKRAADSEERAAMVALLRLAMRQGALGLSSGLEYDPGFYSQTEELIALAREAAAHGGFYMTHIRDEEDGFLKAFDEAVQIGREAGISVQISHIKLGNRTVWGRTREVLGKLEEARQEGIDVTADCYPYDAWASSLSILVPSRRFQDRQEIERSFAKIGGPGNVLITRYTPQPEYEFKSLQEIAEMRQVDAIDIFIEMMSRGGAGIVGRSMNQDDVDRFYKHPHVMVASDGGTDSRHPRMSGTFPRVLGNYVRERRLMSLQEAVRKMTSMPARRLGLKERGLIEEGFYADLVLFNPAQVIDRSDFKEPHRLSEGIELVMVNAAVVWKDGSVSGELPGRRLLRE